MHSLTRVKEHIFKTRHSYLNIFEINIWDTKAVKLRIWYADPLATHLARYLPIGTN